MEFGFLGNLLLMLKFPGKPLSLMQAKSHWGHPDYFDALFVMVSDFVTHDLLNRVKAGCQGYSSYLKIQPLGLKHYLKVGYKNSN